jgi:DNA-binding transcriptional regulator/RsmH inhibitor MraZ
VVGVEIGVEIWAKERLEREMESIEQDEQSARERELEEYRNNRNTTGESR